LHIAIIVPAYNVAPYMRDVLASVIGQTYPHWSAVVVDDGSSDGTAEIAAAFTGVRIKLLRQGNAGVSAARNRGIAASDSDACLFLDADDWLAPDALMRLAEALRDSAAVVAAAGSFARVAPSGSTRVSPRPPGGDLLECLLVRNLFANGGHLLVRRTAVEAAGGFSTGLSYGEDWEYWTRLALRGAFASVASRDPVLFVRERPGSAYLRMATDPASFAPALDAIYTNPEIAGRLAAGRLRTLRRRAEAETAWIVGRELIRHGRCQDGWRWLGRSLRRAPMLRRFGLAGLSWSRMGPFRPYQFADDVRTRNGPQVSRNGVHQ
jgi:glycosyltransferase involved in cell wall biosynthesis